MIVWRSHTRLDQKKTQNHIRPCRPHLPAGDLLVVDDEPVGHGRGQLDGLQPEAHVAFLQDLVVQAVLQRNDCADGDRQS